MALTAPGYVRVHPAFEEPDILLQIAQASGFANLLADERIRVELAEGDLAVYIKRMNVRTAAAGSQSSFTLTAAEFINMSLMSIATYHFSNRAVWARNDEAAASRWGFALPQALELAQEQALYQTARDIFLYGAIPSNGEGLLNAPGAVNVTIPADSNGNTTLTNYDNGEMAQFFLQTIVNMIVSMYQAGLPQRIEILGPQRDILYMQQVGIVQLVQFQRPGAGTDTTAGMIEKIQETAGNKIGWQVDDTLIGKGAGGTDAIVITIPKVVNPEQKPLNTNIFGKVTPNLDNNILMYGDMIRPRKIISPAPYGMTEQIKEWRLSPGWATRGQAVTILNMAY